LSTASGPGLQRPAHTDAVPPQLSLRELAKSALDRDAEIT